MDKDGDARTQDDKDDKDANDASPNSTTMPRVSLRNAFDNDVYQIVKKLEDERQNESSKKDGKKRRKLTVTDVYDSIKKSNSSLARQKRKPLEDAIERALDFRKQEEEESEDSDDLLEQAEKAYKVSIFDETLGDADDDDDDDGDGDNNNNNDDDDNEFDADGQQEEDRFLLNRQMTKHWNVTSTAQGSEGKTTKKRRLSVEEGANANGTEHVSDGSAIVGIKRAKSNGVAASDSVVTKKKPSKYGPEQIPPGSVMVAGLEEAATEVGRYIFMRTRKPENFVPFGEQPVGVLISGPPGTGKQSLVRLLSWKMGIPIIPLGRYLLENRSPEKVGKIVTDVLDEARKVAPSIVLVEHLDEYMAKSSNNSNELQQEVITQLKLGMLRLRDGEAGDRRVMVVATTSKLELIEPSLTRSDYFAETITVNVPDADSREKIFRVLTRNLDIPPEVDFKALAVRTHGFVGEDIRAVIRAANKKASGRYIEMDFARANNAIQGGTMDMSDDNFLDRPIEGFVTWSKYVDDPSYTDPARIHVSQQDFLDAIAKHTPWMRREGFSSVPSTTWSEVGALHSVREAFQVSIVRPIKEPLFFQKFGKQRPAGVLLFGPPGCGKTLVAKAVANDAQASFILIKGPELLNKYVGESERAIRELFTRAKSCAPCILFFDEMDSLVPKRENTTTEAGARVVNALLAELDGAGDRGEVYVIGTSNRPDMIDPAVLRPGRLDQLLFVDLPTEDERVDILRTIVRNGLGGTEGDDIESIARDARCKGFSGADLYGLYKNAVSACVLRYEGGEPALTREDWDVALGKTKPSVSNPETYRKLAAKLHHQY